MVRASAALAILSVLTSAPLERARAQECVEPGHVVSAGMSVVAPHEDLAHGESRDPLLSFTFEARMDAARREVSARPGVILWCMNADDPRCSPVDGSSDASLSTTALRHESPEVPTVAAPAASAVVFAPYEPSPSVGVRSRVDRPPGA